MRSLLHQLDVGVTRASCLNIALTRKYLTGRNGERALPRKNDGDLGPRIMDRDGRVKRLNSTQKSTRAVSAAAAEEDIIAERNGYAQTPADGPFIMISISRYILRSTLGPLGSYCVLVSSHTIPCQHVLFPFISSKLTCRQPTSAALGPISTPSIVPVVCTCCLWGQHPAGFLFQLTSDKHFLDVSDPFEVARTDTLRGCGGARPRS